MARAGRKKAQRYSAEFKVTAVRLSQQPGLQGQTVAHALDIHPFMLSKCRKQVRDGLLRGRPRRVVPERLKRESARLQELERAHALLQTEHALLPAGAALRGLCAKPGCADVRLLAGNLPRALGRMLIGPLS